ncbi:MAG: DmsC/YnfH family molybdoenzyme membrane anchor subunit [Robiginitomaculum sp.]|nr:DmsC/YnfH family molybdoenzyme membrane anchor subunit [Robiginitomaculum sp.]MDQ7077238.1 DmsC/YnfH family molybdoenzyme membrane anchor subunit [Robiginitomaculum sp.]
MHPAKSVIYFTTASGAGYGLMVWLAVMGAFGFLPADRTFGIIGFGLAFFLIISGLLSSTGHLGRPERAWRALSQWRSSWLSREGVSAILTFGPTGLYALGWVVLGQNAGLVGLIGLVGALMCLITVYFTSMIYASLKAIPAWRNRWTSLGYLLMALMSGALIMLALQAVFGLGLITVTIKISVALLGLSGVLKLAYWRAIQTDPPRSTAESATGLGRFGMVRMIESPHGEDNYLLKEMGYKVARKHAGKLRRIALVTGFILPMAMVAAIMVLGLPYVAALSFLALISAGIGLVVERWLFFAEAKHVVTLYYGNSKV